VALGEQEGVRDSWLPSFVCNSLFGNNDGCNHCICHIMHMGNWFEVYYSFLGVVFHCYFPLGDLGYPGFGFPLLGDSAIGGFPLILGFYSFPFYGSFWVDKGDWLYSIVQMLELVE
jgi:hypothetical protein